MKSNYSLAFGLRLMAACTFVAALVEFSSSENHHSSLRTISRRSEIRNQTTVRLPDTFATSNSSTTGKYALIYTHDELEIQPNISLSAVHFGAANLTQALDAAIENATNKAKTEQRQIQINMSFNHLSLIVTPAAAVSQSLSLSWNDFANILEILRNDTLQRPGYSTLFIGAVVGATSGTVYARVAILPELIFSSQAATSAKPTSLESPSRSLQWDAVHGEENAGPGDIEMTGNQGTENDTDSVERFLGVARGGPPIHNTNLRMNVRENRRHRIASDRLREAFDSLRVSVAILPASNPSARVSGSVMSPVIALRRPGNGVYAEFGVMDLAYYDRDELQLTLHELFAVFAALDVLMSQLDRIAFPPSIEIYRYGEDRMIAFFYFWHQSTTDGEALDNALAQNALFTHPVAPDPSLEQGGPPPPEHSSSSVTLGNSALQSHQPYSSIPGSDTWESISQRLQASNQRMCSWWTTCFTGSWPQP